MASGRRPLFDLMTDPSRNPRAGGAASPQSPPPAAPQAAPPTAAAAAQPTPSPLSPPASAPASARPRAVSAFEAKPTPRSAPVRQQAPAEPVTTPESPAEQPGPRAAAVASIPWAWVYWGVTGLVLLFVVIWWGGFNAGKNDAEGRFGKQIDPQGGQTGGQSGPEAPTDLDPRGTPPPIIDDRIMPVHPDPPIVPAGEIYHAGAWVTEDPRVKGMNYLHLVVLPKPDAARAVDYLRSKGRQAVAVPSKVVDRSPEGDKNPSYFVYLLTPLSKDQYRDAATRSRIESDVKALGKEWAKGKDRGPSDFSQPGWVKFD